MKINEVSRQTGLTKRTIRFYIEQGLINPAIVIRNGREYREYSEKDLQELMSIAGLRRAQFTLDQIRTVKLAPERIPEILSDYCREIKQQSLRLNELFTVASAIDTDSVSDLHSLSCAFGKVSEKHPLPEIDRNPRFGRLDSPKYAESPEVKKWHEEQYKPKDYIQPPSVYKPVFHSRGPVIGITPDMEAMGTRWNQYLPKWTGGGVACVIALNASVWIVLGSIGIRSGNSHGTLVIDDPWAIYVAAAFSVLSVLALLFFTLRGILKRRGRRGRR